MARQWIKNIELSNFRNISMAEVSFSPDINIISGENAQGKTNLLEAIWLLSGGRSFRGSKDKELVKIGEKVAHIGANVTDGDSEKYICVACSLSESKKGRFGKVNGGEFIKATNIVGNFYCVVFAPIHLSLVTGAPALRRKFMDACLCQLYPSFIDNWREYNRILEQKNAFLKNVNSYKDSERIAYFDIFDSGLSVYGNRIYEKRKEFCQMLSKLGCEYYRQISSEKEEIEIKYQFAAENEDELYSLHYFNRNKDCRFGYSTCGIHREDIEITINGLAAKDFASQGQQRSIVLALKLAESDIMHQVTGIDPVVLLDDVLSELDFSRQEYLLNNIKNKQVFISSCDSERIKLSDSKKFIVKNGEICECI